MMGTLVCVHPGSPLISRCFLYGLSQGKALPLKPC